MRYATRRLDLEQLEQWASERFTPLTAMSIPKTGRRQLQEASMELLNETLSWGDARRRCGEFNRDLLSISNHAEQKVVQDVLLDLRIKNQGLWIGMTDEPRLLPDMTEPPPARNDFRWSDGTQFTEGLSYYNAEKDSSKKEGVYTNFASPDTIAGGGGCIVILTPSDTEPARFGKWAMKSCDDEKRALCGPVRPTTQPPPDPKAPLYVNKMMNFDDAKENCRDQDRELIVIDSTGKRDAIAKLAI